MKKNLLAAFILFAALSKSYGQGLCDTAYWHHTYLNQRLKIYDSCSSIKGTIDLMLSPPLTGDGDYHIYVLPDSGYEWMQTYRDST